MAKAPPDLPVVGDSVELRGRGCEGTLFMISEVELPGHISRWACVRWTKGMGPRVVHLNELKRLPIDEQSNSGVCRNKPPIPGPG